MRKVLICILCGVIALGGCSVSQFNQVLNEIAPAVTTIIEIVALVKGTPADTTPVAKVSADVSALESLDVDFTNASANAQPGIETQINAAFTTLEGDLSDIFTLAQVSDPATQAKVSALVALVNTAVQIAESAIPNASADQVRNLQLTANGLVDSYNKVLVAKTGNAKLDAFTAKHRIHNHSRFVRIVTGGMEK